MQFLNSIRENFYTQWSWWLLLLTFALTFFLPDRGEAKNLYRVLVALPVLLMLSGPVLKDFFANKSMRWFAAITLYFSISLLWGAEYRSYDNYLLRIAAVWAFAFLLYYLSCYRAELFLQIDKVLVFFGLIWIVLVAYESINLWQGDTQFTPGLVKRGAFYHHLHVGWMIATLTLISLQHALRKNAKQFFWVVITAVLLFVLILAQARGGLLVFFVGLITYLIINFRMLNLRIVLISCVGLLIVILSIFLFQPGIFTSMMARGDASRFVIWQNWLTLWQVSGAKMLFGYGLGASVENEAPNHIAAHFHSFYLNTLYYGGVVGSSLVLIWFFNVVKMVFKRGAFDSSWLIIVVGMLAGFLTDGNSIFNYPGAFTFCFILPVLCLSFEPEALK